MLFKSVDDGLTAVFLTVYPSPVPLQRPTVALDEQFAVAAFKKLHGLQPATDEYGAPRPFLVHLDEDAQQALHEFQKQCREWESDVSGMMKSHIGKLPGIAVRVSLVLALLDWSLDELAAPVSSITKGHLGRACHYVGEHLRKHAHLAYGAVSAPAEIRNARRIAEIIQAENLTQIGTREIQRRGLSGLQSAKSISSAILVLVDADWLAPMDPKTGTTGGRPRKLFAVNPKVGRAK